LTLRSLNVPNVTAAANSFTENSGGKRGGSAAKHAFVVNMKVLVRFLVDEDILEADTLARLKRPKMASPARRPLATWEIQAIRGALTETSTADRDLAMYALSLDTGVRVSELISMREGDLDLEACRVTVWGKGNKQRVIPFGTVERGGGKTAKLLKTYLRRRHPSVPTDLLWLSYNGYPLGDKGWRQVFNKACALVNIKDRTPHELRHTFATRYLVRNPGDVEGLRYTLGHLSDDEYRTYTAEAGRIISDMLGRDSIFEDATDERPERGRVTNIRDRERPQRETARTQLDGRVRAASGDLHPRTPRLRTSGTT
jgi:integrase/recombinase XerD